MYVSTTTESRPQTLGEIPRGSLPAAQRWYCWKAHPGKHIQAHWELAQQGFPVYLPIHVASRTDGIENLRPLFGPYGFVQFDRSQYRWRAIHSTRGVALLISSDALHPIAVPRGIVEALQAKGREGDGVIDDLYQGPAYAPLDGQTVRITTGPFAELHGLCKWSGQKRVAVLLEVMGRLVETEIKRADVEGVL